MAFSGTLKDADVTAALEACKGHHYDHYYYYYYYDDDYYYC